MTKHLLNILKEGYNNKQLIVPPDMANLLNLPQLISSDNVNDLRKIYHTVETQIRSLQPITRYLRLNLLFMRNSALRISLISVFQESFASINKVFILLKRLGTRQSFCEV